MVRWLPDHSRWIDQISGQSGSINQIRENHHILIHIKNTNNHEILFYDLETSKNNVVINHYY